MGSDAADPGSAPSVWARAAALFRRVRVRSFGRADEEPYRRRSRDWFRLGAAVVLLVLLSLRADKPTRTEADVFEFFNQLPAFMSGVGKVLFGVAALWTVGLVVGAALLSRRARLARDLVLAGVGAWAIARVLGAFVVERQGLAKSIQVITRFGTDTPTFPLVRLAVIVAVVAVASPYLGRPARRIGRTLVLLIAFTAMYLGIAYPTDVLGGLVLGWGVAAAVHLIFGSPGGRPTAAQIMAALDELDCPIGAVRLSPRQRTGATFMVAESEYGQLAIKVLGRDEVDAQFLAKAWRWFLFKDSGPVLPLTRRAQVEHEAYVNLLARNAGVRSPEVIVASVAGPKAALLVARRIPGPALDEVDPGSVDDRALDEIWGQIKLLHAARIAHGALNAEHIIVTPDGPAIVGFQAATTNALAERQAHDIAEFLVASATIVGVSRAVAAAVRAVGTDAILPALPLLQPAVLSSSTRRLQGTTRRELTVRLEDLRATAAEAAGTEPPELQQLARMTRTNFLMAVGTLLALFVLMGQVGDPRDVWATIRNATWWWFGVAVGVSLASNIGYAIALMGTTPIRLPLFPTVGLQIGVSFVNLAVPGIGGPTVQIRFLQKQGSDLASAVASAGVLNLAGNVVAQGGLLVLALIATPNRVDIGIPASGVAAAIVSVVVLVGLLAIVLFGLPSLRRRTWPPVQRALHTLRVALRSPRRLTLLLVGNVVAALLLALCLQACLLAFGGSLSFWTVLALSVGVNGLAQMIPVPGGSVAVGTVGMTAIMIALHVPKDVAVSASIANQLAFAYIPAVPGWFLTRTLLRHDYL